MTLQFKVVAHESGDLFTDGKPRVRCKIFEADMAFNEIRFLVNDLNSLPLGKIIKLTNEPT